MRCVNCGQQLRPGDAFCARCGGAAYAPPPPAAPWPPPAPTRSGLAVPMLVVGLVLLVAAAGVGGVLLARHHAAAVAIPAASSTPRPIAPPIAPVVPSAPSDVVPSSAEPEQPLDDTAAKAALDDEVDQDRAAAEQLVGTWVPQLSSKRPGLVADGVTYDYPQIWTNFQELRAEYPTALLIWSGDYHSFKLGDFYVTVVPESYSDGGSANQWCDGAGLAPADCYAKFLSHQGGSAGTTLLRK